MRDSSALVRVRTWASCFPLLVALLHCSSTSDAPNRGGANSAGEVSSDASGGAEAGRGGQAGELAPSTSGAAALGGQPPSAAGSEEPGPSEAGVAGAGGATPEAPKPAIINVSKQKITRGDTVVVYGEHFLPSPEVLLGDRVVAATSPVADDQLSFGVPTDLALGDCVTPLTLAVRNSAGSSEVVAVTGIIPPPSFSVDQATGVAGTEWTVAGAALTNARVTLNGSPVSATLESDSQLVVSIPRNAPHGAAALFAENECGAAALPLTILAPQPRLLSADLTQLVPGAVVMLKVDVSDGATVNHVNVAGTTIDPTDATSFQWADEGADADTKTLAVRIPTTAPLGLQSVELFGEGDTHSSVSVNLATVAGLVPARSSTILLPALAQADYPIGTTTPFPQDDPLTPIPPDEQVWVYDLQFPSNFQCGMQPFNSIERWCPDIKTNPSCATSYSCVTGGYDHADAGTPGVATECHAMKGEFQVDQSTNFVSVTIDRNSLDGPEPYLGGWQTVQGKVYLVLRSQRTGLMLYIRHEMAPVHCR